jgi:flagellar biosynthesis protein FlhG
MRHHCSTRLWAIGGGKGGVGKSLVTLGLGLALSRLGKKVILIDGDLGGANLNTLLGLPFPRVTLDDFLAQQIHQLTDAVIPSGIPGLSLICGAEGLLGSANPTYFQKLRLFKELELLPADFVLVDLGAGTSYAMLDLFNHAPGKLVVFTGQSTSLQNAYGFIKGALFRRLAKEFRGEKQLLIRIYSLGDHEAAAPLNSMQELRDLLREEAPHLDWRLAEVLEHYTVYLVANMVKHPADHQAPGIMQSVCRKFLEVRPQILGSLDFEPLVERVINGRKPLLLFQKKNEVALSLELMARRLLALSRLTGETAPAGRRSGERERKPNLSRGLGKPRL